MSLHERERLRGLLESARLRLVLSRTDKDRAQALLDIAVYRERLKELSQKAKAV